jgi:hypothetical protein
MTEATAEETEWTDDMIDRLALDIESTIKANEERLSERDFSEGAFLRQQKDSLTALIP